MKKQETIKSFTNTHLIHNKAKKNKRETKNSWNKQKIAHKKTDYLSHTRSIDVKWHKHTN